MHRLACSTLLTLCLLPGCASTAAPEGPLAMARPLGTLQCEARETTATALAQTLRDAGVAVQAVRDSCVTGRA